MAPATLPGFVSDELLKDVLIRRNGEFFSLFCHSCTELKRSVPSYQEPNQLYKHNTCKLKTPLP